VAFCHASFKDKAAIPDVSLSKPLTMSSKKIIIKNNSGENEQNQVQTQMLPRKRHANLSPTPPNGSDVFRQRAHSRSFDAQNQGRGLSSVGRTRSSEDAEANVYEECTALHASFDSSLLTTEEKVGMESRVFPSKKKSIFEHCSNVCIEKPKKSYPHLSDVNENNEFLSPFGIGESLDLSVRLNSSSRKQLERNISREKQHGSPHRSLQVNFDRNYGDGTSMKILEVSSSLATGQVNLGQLNTATNISLNHITPTDLKTELSMHTSDEKQRRKADMRKTVHAEISTSLRKRDYNNGRASGGRIDHAVNKNCPRNDLWSQDKISRALKSKSSNHLDDVNSSGTLCTDSAPKNQPCNSNTNSTGTLTALAKSKQSFIPCLPSNIANSNGAALLPSSQTMRPPSMPQNRGYVQGQLNSVAESKLNSLSAPAALTQLVVNDSSSNYHLNNNSCAVRNNRSMPPPTHTPIRKPIFWNSSLPPEIPTQPPTCKSSNATSTTSFSKTQAEENKRPIATPQRQSVAIGIPTDLKGSSAKPSDGSQCSCVLSLPETPFRFTSFPASLPRVHPRSFCAPGSACDNETTPSRAMRQVDFQSPFLGKQADSSAGGMIHQPFYNSIPGTVRKRMDFTKQVKVPTNTMDHSQNNEKEDDCLNTSNDDSHNTSMSSLSVDGATPVILPSRIITNLDSGTTSRAVWLSPVLNDGKGQIMQGSPVPANAKLCMEDQDEDMSLHDSQKQGIKDGTKMCPLINVASSKTVVGTKLNFNSLMSPDPTGTIENFRDSHQNDDHDTDEDTTPRCNGGDSVKQPTNISKSAQHDIREPYDQIRTCSFPSVSTDTSIRNVSGAMTSGDDTLNTTSGAYIPFQFDGGVGINVRNAQEEHFRLHLDSTQCSPIEKVPIEVGFVDNEEEEEVVVEEEEVSNASTARKLRPMPDMSAFDMGSSTTISSLQNPESSGETGDHSGISAHLNQSPLKLLCPPTPVRTPAWAHNGGLTRKNSLITTKLLAACAPQTLDELSSFETSVVEDEKSSSQNGENHPNSLAVSFSAVLEEDELGNMSSEIDGSVVFKDSHQEDMSMDGTRKRRNSRCSFKSIRSVAGLDAEAVLNDTSFKVSKSGRSSIGLDEAGSSAISFELDFENLGCLGRGSFGDVFKARSKSNNSLYAVKRNRRQFRGKRDRDRALEEVRIMQRLQNLASTHERNQNNLHCLHVLLFIRAWQEDGHLFCQTELCCRDTCQQLILSLTTNWDSSSKVYSSLARNLPTICHDKMGHLVPETTIWKIFHDVAVGLSHIHSHGIVHHDIKPLNIFFVSHPRLGALCKIGDFGMAGDIGTVDDGQEGDTIYMPQELLTCPTKHPRSDIFSLGLTIYELSSSGSWKLPTEGSRWHEIRNGLHVPELPASRSKTLVSLIQKMINSNKDQRPTAKDILSSNEKINSAGVEPDNFLSEYVRDVQDFDQAREREFILAQVEANQSRHTPTPLLNGRNMAGIESDRSWNVRTPTPGSGISGYNIHPKR